MTADDHRQESDPGQAHGQEPNPARKLLADHIEAPPPEIRSRFHLPPSRKTGQDGASVAELPGDLDDSETDAPHASSFSGRFGVFSLEDPPLPRRTEATPRAGVRVRRRRALQLVAAEQAGCFTLAQAATAGFDRRARYHHLSYGNWRRTDAPGVFRLASWPHDPLERFRAWSLATAEPPTSWTALEALGLTVVGPRAPVHLAVPDRRRRTHLLSTSCAPPAPVQLHVALAPGRPSVERDGLLVRPAHEAMCVAVMTTRPRSVPLALADELVAAGRLDVAELLDVAAAIGAGAVMDHFWERGERARGRAA